MVSNASFENHDPIDCLSCNMWNEVFSKAMSGWKNLNTHTTICDCNYQKKASEGPYKYGEVCPLEKVSPKDGCTMIQMGYQPNCLDFDHATQGCASYLGTLLKEQLEMGKKYEISFWLYIAAPKDPGYERHIGFTLFPDKIRNPNGAMIPQNVFQIDTIIYHEWYPVKWKIQPTCPLQYLVLGVFRGVEGPPVHNIDRPADNYYFIDKVAVTEIAANTKISQDEVTFFCKPELIPGLTVKTEVEGVSTYFDSGDDQLSAASRGALDAFAVRAQQEPKTTFLISGHTDNIGSDHKILSKKRIESVLTYLATKHKIPKLRFIALPKGIEEPKNNNESEAARKQNRRVVIEQRDFDIDKVIYRNLLTHVFQKNEEEAFKTLNVWLHVAKQKAKILMIHDPRIEVLKSGARWNSVKDRVRKSYQEFPNYRLAYSLDSLWAEDQKGRTLKFYIENLGAYLHHIDSTNTAWDVNFYFTEKEKIQRDQNQLSALMQCLDNGNWVKASDVGERAATANFLIIQHSMDTILLKKYLPKLKARCLKGEAKWRYYAMMYDRLQIIQDLPQRYGTQYKNMGDKQVLFPLEDASKVDIWRNEIGLEALN